MMCVPGLEGEWARAHWRAERRRWRRQLIGAALLTGAALLLLDRAAVLFLGITYLTPSAEG